MKDKEKENRGLWSLIRESMTKTGGCCGSGETCCGTAGKTEEDNVKEASGSQGNERK